MALSKIKILPVSSPSPTSLLCSHFLTGLWNSKRVSFLGMLHPQAKPFWIITKYFITPTWSVPPLLDHGVQVFSFANKAKLLALNFKWIHHLNLHVATAKHARMVNCTINKYLRRLHQHVTEAQLTNLYELWRLIQSLKTKSLPGTDSISATMLLNLSHKALSHFTQLFNLILRFGYFPYAWKSTKVIPSLEHGKPLSDHGSHKPISLLSTVSKLPEQVVAHRLNSFIHQNSTSRMIWLPQTYYSLPTCQSRRLHHPWL